MSYRPSGDESGKPAAYPPWGTPEALRWGIAHPDWPWHTPETRAEYEWPTGRWWRERGKT